MTGREFSDQFDVLYNNITSNQAPGLNEYEKSVFLTKAQDELIKNYFLPQSNSKQAGFDGNQKRQMDFSLLMCTHGAKPIEGSNGGAYSAGGTSITKAEYDPQFLSSLSFDPRGTLYVMPQDLFIPINETLHFVVKTAKTTSPGTYEFTTQFQRQVVPLSFEEYTRLMSKPYKEPLKHQAWRLLVDNAFRSSDTISNNHYEGKLAEIIAGHNDLKWLKTDNNSNKFMQYIIRYIRKPKPIIVAPIDSWGITINGHDGHYTNDSDYDDAYIYDDTTHTEIVNPCELDESLHEEILQRAVELAKVAWTATGQDNVQLEFEAGKRSE